MGENSSNDPSFQFHNNSCTISRIPPVSIILTFSIIRYNYPTIYKIIKLSNRLPIYSLQINLWLNWKELDKLVQNLSNINTWSVFQALKNISRYPIIIQKKNIVIFRESNSFFFLNFIKKKKEREYESIQKRTHCLVVQISYLKTLKQIDTKNWEKEEDKKKREERAKRKKIEENGRLFSQIRVWFDIDNRRYLERIVLTWHGTSVSSFSPDVSSPLSILQRRIRPIHRQFSIFFFFLFFLSILLYFLKFPLGIKLSLEIPSWKEFLFVWSTNSFSRCPG